jgi:hypothetical protein
MATDTSTHLYNSLLALSSRTSQDGLLSAFSSISHTVEENAKNRKERSRAALDAAEELSPAQEFLEEAKDFSETVDKAKDAMLDHLKKEYEATYTTAAGRMSGSAYGAIWTAYVIARLARTAAVSAMDAKASEVRAAYASKTAATALKPTAESSAADAKGAASVARSAAEQSSALAVQAAASALDLLKKLRDSGSLAEKIDKGIKELEAIEAIKGAATSVVGGILLDTEGKAAEAEKAARSAASAADAAVAVAGTTEKAEGAAQKVEGEAEGTEKAGSAKEVTALTNHIDQVFNRRLIIVSFGCIGNCK